jgi:hypothetical protein
MVNPMNWSEMGGREREGSKRCEDWVIRFFEKREIALK